MEVPTEDKLSQNECARKEINNHPAVISPTNKNHKIKKRKDLEDPLNQQLRKCPSDN
jgi:hypothetical protein